MSGARDWGERGRAGLQTQALGCSVPWDTFVREGWLLMDHPMEEQESAELHHPVLWETPNLYKQCLLGAPHFGAEKRQHCQSV